MLMLRSAPCDGARWRAGDRRDEHDYERPEIAGIIRAGERASARCTNKAAIFRRVLHEDGVLRLLHSRWSEMLSDSKKPNWSLHFSSSPVPSQSVRTLASSL